MLWPLADTTIGRATARPIQAQSRLGGLHYLEPDQRAHKVGDSQTPLHLVRRNLPPRHCDRRQAKVSTSAWQFQALQAELRQRSRRLVRLEEAPERRFCARRANILPL